MSTKTVNVLGYATNNEQFIVKARNLDIRISKNPKVSDLEGPSPIEYILAGFAGCINAVGKLVAKELDIDLQSLQVEISADLDTDKYNGIPTHNRAGFNHIGVVVKPTSDASPEKLQDWLRQVEYRCPVQDNLINPTPVSVTIATTPEAVIAA
ncbi:OsmC family protein [Flavobacterium sp.]|uniref:OsmC family protein n=1 Tax=Flavobacterium sp. TaxID=239 RepID=UPI0039E48661